MRSLHTLLAQLPLLGSFSDKATFNDGSQEVASADRNCPPQVSCPLMDPGTIDTCCLNHPSGHFLMTQFWDSSPALGANDTWTIHGTWPDLCHGGFDAFCDKSRSRTPQEITQILSRASSLSPDHPGSHPGLIEYMSEHWLSISSRNSDLWSHEWNKHGTCVSTLEPSCYPSSNTTSKANEDAAILDYFAHTVYLYNQLDTFHALAAHHIYPSTHTTYALAHLQKAVTESGHGFPVTFKCRNHNELSEIWYHFLVSGSLRDAKTIWSEQNGKKFIPVKPDGIISNCPKEGIRYLPKGKWEEPEPTTTGYGPTATHTHVAPTSTGGMGKPFAGKGNLMVKVVDDEDQTFAMETDEDGYTGCLIKKGTWYNARSRSSCATFVARDDVLSAERDDGTGDSEYHLFTLESRLAPCAFVHENRGEDVRFGCERDLGVQAIFSNMNGTAGRDGGRDRVLMFSDQHQSSFYAADAPRGWKQEKIWREAGEGRDVQVEIWWEPLQ